MPVVELDTPLGKLSLNIQCLGIEPVGPLLGCAAGAVDVSIASSFPAAGPSGPANAGTRKRLADSPAGDGPELKQQVLPERICEICCKAFKPKKSFYTVCSWDCFCTRRELKSMSDLGGTAAHAAQDRADGGAYGSQ